MWHSSEFRGGLTENARTGRGKRMPQRNAGAIRVQTFGSAPHGKVDRPAHPFVMAFVTGTEGTSESRPANGPSAATNGLQTPAANQIG
jgi:hypothetical protein